MKISKIIIYILAVSILFTSLWGCAKKEDRSKEESDTNSESKIQPSTDGSQIIKSEETMSQASVPDIPAKAEKEVGKDNHETLQKKVDEVRRAFISLQEVCKANDIDGYLDFWDDETKKEVDGRDIDLLERRERRRESLTKRPGALQEIANAKVESITADTSQAEKIEMMFGVGIKGTMMLVRTNGRAFLFHETDKGWKLFTVGPPEYFR
jgi:FtsZ-interacting cell division protein ZipA